MFVTFQSILKFNMRFQKEDKQYTVHNTVLEKNLYPQGDHKIGQTKQISQVSQCLIFAKKWTEKVVKSNLEQYYLGQ